jgi:glycosyltransferase involved in cell wall biosynthesis
MSVNHQESFKDTSREDPLQVCYFGTYRASYNRNQILIAGLRVNGIDVSECHAKLWHGIEDRIDIASGGWLRPKFWLRLFKTYWRLLQKYRQIPDYDVMMVGYPGHIDVFFAWLITRIHRKPLVWDVLNSLYLISTERGITERHPLIGKLIKFGEKIACNLPDLLLLDTEIFIEWFRKTHKLRHSRFRIVEIGADDRIFNRTEELSKLSGKMFTILYYGSYIPNHGVSYIAEAARKLSVESDIRFRMVGEGPEQEQIQAFASDAGLDNIQFIDWLPRQELVDIINQSNLVLGVFGTTNQVNLTNNNKVMEGFALEKPVLSARSPVLHPEIIHRENIYLVAQGSPEEIAEAILILKNQPLLRTKIAKNGYQLFMRKFSTKAIGSHLASHLSELLENRVHPS